MPDAVDRAGGELAAGLYVGNGFGKLIGATQLVELGVIETPIVLTGTLSAFRAADALVTYMLGLAGNEEMRTVNPVVGETNDGYLSDIRARPITEQHVLSAITGARTGPVAQGCVGAGTGTAALGFKAGHRHRVAAADLCPTASPAHLASWSNPTSPARSPCKASASSPSKPLPSLIWIPTTPAATPA